VAPDLAVLGQDPRFGGGGVAQSDAFCAAARELGRDPVLLSCPHPGLGGPRVTWRRVEALRQASAARRLEPPARQARSLWVAASLAQNGAAAPRTKRPYSCWIGTTLASEWAGRGRGLPPWRRIAAGASVPWLERLERDVLGGARTLYATSPASRAGVAAAAGRPERDIGILPIPIDSERFSPAPDQDWRGLLEGPILVFVGRADDPRKNLPLLLRAFAEARETLPNARLRLVGAAPSAPTPAGVEVVGRVDDVASELRKSALFVLPSSQEGFCIAAAEALAAGLPVVSTPCGGPEEMIRSSGGGVVVESFEASDLAAAITGVVSDVGGAAAMRAAGRDHVRRLHAPDRFRELLADALRKADD
jgi:glycosyltransferase involved in cell wall biosynthesis